MKEKFYHFQKFHCGEEGGSGVLAGVEGLRGMYLFSRCQSLSVS